MKKMNLKALLIAAAFCFSLVGGALAAENGHMNILEETYPIHVVKTAETEDGSKVPPDPETPGTETPDPENPGTETPDPENPGTDTPDPENPGTETPDPENPGTETPDPENPGTDTPDPENPGTETPDPETPGAETPDPENPGTETPDPENPGTEPPDPENPGTETPDPENPGTETPDPETPGTETPDPENPGTETPEPENPGTETPDPENPGTDTPDPENPGAETPDPENPGTDTPDPENPGMETPTPETPGTDTPDPENPGTEPPDPEEPVPQRKPIGHSELQLVAHRGFSSQYPENTLAAFRKAAEYGFDAFECDVFECNNGDLLIFHDSTLERACGKDEYIWNLTEKTRSLYPVTIGTDKNYRKETYLIPTLDEALDVVKQTGITMYLEIKPPRPADNHPLMSQKAADTIVRKIKEAGLEEKVYVFGREYADIDLFQGSGLHVGFLTMRAPLNEGLIQNVVRHGCDFINAYPESSLKGVNMAEFLELAHSYGVRVGDGQGASVSWLNQSKDAHFDFIISDCQLENIKEAQLSGKKTAPTSVTLSKEKAAVKWKPVKGAESYRIYRKVDDGKWTRVADIPFCDAASWTDTTAKTPGAVYSYRVLAENALGVTKAGGERSVTYLPAASVTLKGKSKQKIAVSWKKVTGAAGYQVQYGLKSSFSDAKTIKCDSKTLSATLSKLKKGKTYYVRVRSWQKTDSGTVYSKWSSKKKLKVK